MSPLKKLIFPSIFMFIGSFSLQAQNFPSYNIKHYNIHDGLSNNWISNIFQDKDGFLWLGTQYGLNRFDGQYFKIFTYIPGDSTALKANWVRSITQLDDHNIYIGTLGGGITILDPYKEKFTDLEVKLDTYKHDLSLINKLVPDNNKNMWISCASGAFRYHPKDSTLKRFYNQGSVNISISKSGSKLILGRKEVPNSKKNAQARVCYHVVHDTIQRVPVPEDQKLINIFSITADSTLVYTNKGLYLAHKSHGIWQRQKLRFKSPYKTHKQDISFIFRDKEGYFWVNSGHKIYRFSPDFTRQEVIDIETLLNRQFPMGIKVNCMFQDKENNYWLGTSQGLFQLIKHKSFRHPILGHLGKVRETVECGNNMWFALSDGIYSWDKTKINPPIRVNEHVVTSMICASDAFIYTMDNDTNRQSPLIKIDPVTNKKSYIYFPNLDFSTSICWRIIEDLNQRLWIAQWGHIIVYSLKDQSYFSIDFSNKHIGILDLYLDKSDNVWVGSIGKGLFKFSNASSIVEENHHSYEQYSHDFLNPNSISSNLIQSIQQDDNGLLWIGTDGGLNSFDIKDETFKRYVRNDQIPNDKILTITNDAKGKLWLSTVSHGILSFDVHTKKIDHFMTTDGLYDNSMLISSAYLDKAGSLWLGSETGIQYFHPDQLTASKIEAPNIVWESYTKFKTDTSTVHKFPNKNALNDHTLTIFPDDQSINFSFKTLTFEKHEKVRYHFKLEGYHNQWLPSQENGNLILSNLPKGSFKLLVKATLQGHWKISYKPIEVTVIPPWYKTNLAYAIYSILTLSLIFVAYQIQLSIKVTKREKEFVSDLSKAKSRWFNQIAHEFRTPLTVILGATDQIRDQTSSKFRKRTQNHLSQIEEQANHLSNQVQQILEIARTQNDQLEIRVNDSDFITFQRYLFYSFSSLAEKNKITLNFSSSHDSLYLSFDEDKWRKITTNLVSNAIKYNVLGGHVLFSIVFEEQDHNITIMVKDTGIGMNETFLFNLFDPFTKENIDGSQGVGLGLTLTKELIQIMGGSISVSSIKGIGTTFTLKAPMTKSNENSAIEHKNIIIPGDNETPVVLIAEDHKEIREYIHFCLSSDFITLQAENGLTAWELCENHIPDLVISDIMMPEYDGIQLSAKIRENIATNHIPIILLTAKSGQTNQLKGLKVGADAYLTKPFDRQELFVRVDNLIKTRKKLQERYQSGEILVTSENNVIDSFMNTVIQVIQKHMDNDEFGVPQLAEHLHISRVHLYRKIKNLTGLSPTKFIRKVRLKKAQELLRVSELTISEVAYQTGFKDPAYFTRVHIEEFGKSPSEFRK